MKIIIQRLLITAALALGFVMPARAAGAQSSQRGQPKTPFNVADFSKLRWLEGTWRATAPGETTRVEKYHFSSDSTIDITYYADSLSGRQTGESRVYLSVGRVYQTLGPGRWGATRVDSAGVYFIPQVNAHTTFAWAFKSPNSWTSTMRSGMGGQERVTVYQMQRIGQ